MSDESTRAIEGEIIDSSEAPKSPTRPTEREQSTTVGTGSYVAVSCTFMALALTFLILGILFLIRWIS